MCSFEMHNKKATYLLSYIKLAMQTGGIVGDD